MKHHNQRSAVAWMAGPLVLIAGVPSIAWGQSLAEIDNEALFLSQTGATVIELPVGGVAGTPSFGGVTVTAHTGSSIGSGTDASPLIEPTDMTISGVENWNVALDSPAFGFGFEMVDDPGSFSTWTFTLFSGGAGGTQVGTYNFQRTASVLSYVGGVSDTAFDYVEIRETGTNQNDVFGRFAVTSSAGEFWTAAGSGNWDTPGNWTGGTAPIATDNVFITDSPTMTITGPAAATTVNSLTVDNQDLTNSGGAGTTTLNLSTGAMTVTDGLIVGSTATDSGTSILNVGSSTLNVGGDTSIRDGGTLNVGSGTYNPTGAVNLEGGTFSIDSLGALTPNWTSGTLQITGVSGLDIAFGGQFDNFGIDASRSLDVTNGLSVAPAATLLVNGGTVQAGDLDISVTSSFTHEGGSTTVNGTLTNVGGTINLNGGQVTVDDFDNSLGTNLNLNGGTLIVDGGVFTPQLAVPSLTLDGASGGPTLELINGASADFTADINVASTNDGGLAVLSGSSLSTTTDLLIGQTKADSDSTNTFSGVGTSVDISGNFLMGTGTTTGDQARNQLTVEDGAVLTVDGNTTLGSNARVDLTGGTINTSSWTRLGFSQFSHTGGTLNVDTGNFNSGTSNYVLGGTDRPIVNLTNGASYTGGGSTNVDITNGEMHVLSGSTMNLTTGTASLQVFNTGAGGAGLMEVDGAGSSVTVSGLVDIGTTTGGDGTLIITNGGSFTANSTMAIAENDTTIGLVTVDGMGSSLAVAAGGLFVGNEGTATFNVTNGGLVSAVNLTIADSDTNNSGTGTSVMTVNGSDGLNPSTLNVGGSSYIGGSTNEDGGVGILNVQAGALYNSNGGIIGSGDNSGPDGTGTVNITGTNSFWNSVANGSSDIFVGDTGAGTLNVTAGGRVDADAIFLGRLAGSETAEMFVDGSNSVVNVRGVFVVGNQRLATLEVTDGATLNTSTTGNAEFLIGNTTTADNSSVLIDDASIVHNGTGRVAVGDESNGTPSSMTIQNGGSFTSAGSWFFVGDVGGSTGEVVVDGEGSLLSVGPRIAMGDNGSGTMTVRNGGDVVVTDAGGYFEVSAFTGGSGTMTVTDPGSTVTIGNYLSVGDEGTADGTLNIENGATVSTGGHSYIARASSSSTGVITVQDLNTGDGSSGSTLNVGGGLYLGGNVSGGGGDATLNVESGGTVNITGLLKLWDDGKVNLNGGTINTVTFDLEDPPEAPQPDFTFTSGTFRYTAGATLNSETLDDLLGPGVPTLTASKHLVVTDQAVLSAPVRLNGGTLSVGSVFNNDTSNLDFDTGTFNLTTDNLTVGTGGLFGSAMVVNLDQTVNVTNLVTVDAGAELTVIGDFSSGGLTNNGDLVLIDTTGSGKSITGTVNTPAGSNVTLVGDITFNDAVSGAGGFFGPGTATFAGGYSPGDSPAAVAFEGNITFDPANTLTIELGGLNAGSEFDQLNIEGDAQLGGLLDVLLINGFAPGLGDSFQILNAANLAGTFASLNTPALAAGLEWDVVYGASDVLLEVVATLEGDLNGDGFVGIADLNLVLGNWNQTVPPGDPLADPSGDNFIGIADLNTVLGNWNAGTPPGATSSNIPEPATMTLVLSGLLMMTNHRKRGA